ncbi:MAG: DUF4363 family protein [Bacillota bacterium]|nr:DUF4363 family protein [Bacillota bacterium]
MFDRTYIRIWIAFIWVLAFITMGLFFEYGVLNKDLLLFNLTNLESNVVNKDWENAATEFVKLENNWRQQRFFIQLNNGTSDVSSFSAKLAQIKTLVYNEKEEALGAIGELKSLAASITEAFPGP